MELKPAQQKKKEPTIIYEFVEREAWDTENELNMAFDILFEEVLKAQKSAKGVVHFE